MLKFLYQKPIFLNRTSIKTLFFLDEPKKNKVFILKLAAGGGD